MIPIKNPCLKDKLISKGLVTPDQIAVALIHQRHHKKLLGETLTDLGFISDPVALQHLLSEHTGYPFVNLDLTLIKTDSAMELPYEFALQHRLIIFDEIDSTFHCAMADPEDIFAKDELSSLFSGKPITYYHAHPPQILQALTRTYPKVQYSLTAETEVIRLVENLLLAAIHAEASDIHLYPEDAIVQVMFRCDGLLQPHQVLHKNLWAALCVRLKIISHLDIAESRRPQSGHFVFHSHGREINFRVSTHPTLHGESLVIRIFDPGKVILDIETLGFNENHLNSLRRMIQASQGLIILCGPTGSGKTTTLYTLLASMDHHKYHIATLEQPIEYKVKGIRQTEITHPDVLSFANGIRSLLRQDLDILMVGEVRDEETAKMALRAAMTGHLVLTTVHAPDCLGAIRRLQDLGLKVETLLPHLLGVISQRLIRKFCKSCQGNGCTNCTYKKYAGRTVIAEILEMTPTLLSSLQQNLALPPNAFPSLLQDALDRVTQGLTSTEEIQRVVDCNI